MRIDLATGEVTHLRSLAGLGFHIGLEFDTVNDKLYLATFGEPYHRMDADGGNLEALAVLGAVPGDLFVSGEHELVCWTDAIEDTITCGDLDMQNAALVIDSGLDVVSALAVLLP